MKIEKIVVRDENDQLIEFDVQTGVGIFITGDQQRLILPTQDDALNMEVIRGAMSKWGN